MLLSVCIVYRETSTIRDFIQIENMIFTTIEYSIPKSMVFWMKFCWCTLYSHAKANPESGLTQKYVSIKKFTIFT